MTVRTGLFDESEDRAAFEKMLADNRHNRPKGMGGRGERDGALMKSISDKVRLVNKASDPDTVARDIRSELVQRIAEALRGTNNE